MEGFRARDLLSVAGILTLVRVPLAITFPFFATNRAVAVGILAAAGLSDVLDGWVARRTGRTTVAGGIVDPIADKLFVGVVVVTLFVIGRLSLVTTLLLGVRDLLELPLVLQLALGTRSPKNPSRRPRANALGKVATVLQFATVTAAFIHPRWVPFVAVAAGVSGVLAGASYWTLPTRHDPAGSEQNLRRGDRAG